MSLAALTAYGIISTADDPKPPFRKPEICLKSSDDGHGARNGWFSVRNAYYLERIARAGFVSIHTVGANTFVVPPGVKQRFLGTRLLAIALTGIPIP